MRILMKHLAKSVLLGLAVALLAPALFRISETSVSAEELPSAGGALPDGIYTLSEDVVLGGTLVIGGNATIRLDGHSLSLAEGAEGSVLSVKNTLRVEGEGEIKGGNSAYGGGIYVAGQLTLSGNVSVKSNTGSNIYLTRGNTLSLDGFTGEAGVTMASPGAFATGSPVSGRFFSDDPSYSVAAKGDGYSLVTAPLASIEATVKTETLYPTTPLSEIEVTVRGTNVNGVEYPADKLGYDLSGELTVGESVLTVTARGEGGEQVTTTVSVRVKKPELVSIECSFVQDKVYYFDVPVEEFSEKLTVTGLYRDGISRRIGATQNQTAAFNPREEYLDEYYVLSPAGGKLQAGTCVVVAAVGEKNASFTVEISKRVVDVSEIAVRDAVIIQGQQGGRELFTPALPDGVTAFPFIGGELVEFSELAPGVYRVEISVAVLDTVNYERTEGTLYATLTVNRTVYERYSESGEKILIAEREGGVPPEWEIRAEDVSGENYYRLGGGYDVKQTIRITLLPGASAQETGIVRVRLLLSESLRGEQDLKFYRVEADGGVVEVAAARDGDYLTFEESNLFETDFVIAAESHFGVYLALTIVFGVACVAGAGALLWYFRFKRKMKLK